mgnify:CR=1 FL=1
MNVINTAQLDLFSHPAVIAGALMVAEAGGAYRAATEGDVLKAAEAALRAKLNDGPLLDHSGSVSDFLRMRMGALEHEEFAVLYLDTKRRFLTLETLFRGTLACASVYPREIVKRALQVNAAAVVLAHNHPSGDVTPSRADQALTQTLKAALALVDVCVLDHVVVGATETLSMAKHGLV